VKTTVRLAATGLLAAATAAVGASLFATPAAATGTIHHDQDAVFVQTDGLDTNAVLALDRAPDGSLTLAGTYPTGGTGANLTGAVVDHLASMGSLTLDRTHHELYVVNAGSNTISVFGVFGDRLVRRQVVSSGGTFPNSIAVHGNLVYVLNARDGGSIQGYVRIGGTLVRVPAWHRTLGLDPTLTPEFTHTPGQIAFTPDGRQLLVTTKAAANTIDVFTVDRLGGPSATPTVNSLPGTVPFAMTFDQRGHLVLAEAGPSAVATFTVNRNGTLAALGQLATGQAATCWVAADGNTVFTSNAGSATVSGFTLAGNGTPTALGNTATDPGTVDASVSSDGRFLLVQTGASGIVDSFRINRDGSLTKAGSITVPGTVGSEGIAAS
jgi:6-phosphogluconolactonase (cycloisomerase 2 family)